MPAQAPTAPSDGRWVPEAASKTSVPRDWLKRCTDGVQPPDIRIVSHGMTSVPFASLAGMDAAAAVGAGDRRAGMDRDVAVRAPPLPPRCSGVRTLIDDSGDRHPRRVQIDGGAVGAVIGGRDHDPSSDLDAIPMQIQRAAEASMMPGRSLPGKTKGRSIAPVASTTRPARTCHNRSRGNPAGG